MAASKWSWTKWICEKFGLEIRKRSVQHRSAPRRRLQIEALEHRCLPSSGTLDLTFGTAGTGIVTTSIGGSGQSQQVAIEANGNIDVAGSVNINGQFEFDLARYTSAGVPDTTFGGGSGIVTTPVGSEAGASGLAIDANGNIDVAGSAFAGGRWGAFLARYTSAGVPDTTFGGGSGIVTTPALMFVYGLDIDANGNIDIAGNVLVGGQVELTLARYTSAGVLDTTFGGGTGIVTTPVGSSAGAYGVAIDTNGNIDVAGYAAMGPNASNDEFLLARYTSAGVLDTTFGGGSGIVTTPVGSSAGAYGLAIDTNGNIDVVGAGDVNRGGLALARYTSVGALDPSFGGGTGMVINDGIGVGQTLAIDANGNIDVATYDNPGIA